MSEINDLIETIKKIPKTKLDNRIVLIPGERVKYISKETGEEKTTLKPFDIFQPVVDKCLESGIEYKLNEFIPPCNEDGKLQVLMISKNVIRKHLNLSPEMRLIKNDSDNSDNSDDLEKKAPGMIYRLDDYR